MGREGAPPSKGKPEGKGGAGKESWGSGSGTATGEVRATASREAKTIDVAAMMCGVMRKFRV